MIARKPSHETPYFCFICGYYCDLEHKHTKEEEAKYYSSGYAQHFKPSQEELEELNIVERRGFEGYP